MKSLVVFSFSMLLSLIGLLFGWCTAAHAKDSRAEVAFQVQVVGSNTAMRCWRQPLANGRPGETVMVCDVPRKVRVGVTTVTHVGR